MSKVVLAFCATPPILLRDWSRLPSACPVKCFPWSIGKEAVQKGSALLPHPRTTVGAFREVCLAMTDPPAPKRQRRTGKPCSWAQLSPDLQKYHDDEWGTPTYDDSVVFEFLILETFQAGLNWLLILRKRENFRTAFHDFDVDRVAAMSEDDVKRLLEDKGIVRNRLKIRAAISNAQAVVRMRDEEQLGLAHYFWSWVDYVPQENFRLKSMLTKNELSDSISKDMKKRGFKFIGSTVIYSHLQATGIVNDHVSTCPRQKEIKSLLRKKPAQ